MTGCLPLVEPAKDGQGRRIFFVNRYFFPDQSATSQILGDLAFHLAARGEEVHVLTSRSSYDDPSAVLPENAVVEGVKIHRVWTSRLGGRSLFGRLLDYLAFYIAGSARLFHLVRENDIVVAMTDPPMLSVTAGMIAGLRKFRLVNWIQDLYPEIAIELGVYWLRGPAGRVLAHLRNRSLRRANMNVVIGKAMEQRLLALGVDQDRIATIQNWTDDAELRPLAGENPLRDAWNLRGKFVVGYSGNLGKAHEVETILAAADLLREQDKFVFLFIGGSRRFSDLQKVCAARNLGNFIFREHQKRSLLSYSLAVADVHWLSLRPTLEGLILPSKFYGIAAAGRPIIAIVDPGSEIAALVTDHACGAVIAPSNGCQLADVLRALSESQEARSRMGANARRMLDEKFGKSQALARWENTLETVS